MIFDSDQDVFDFIKRHQAVNPHFVKARSYKKELLSLIDGEGFIEELVTRIEFLETEGRILARKKYSRSIADVFQRLFQPIGNIFHSTGGSFDINITNEKEKKEFITKLSNVRDEKTLKQYLESDWMPLYHIDPNGLIFTEYSTINDITDVYPTYKSIDSIRYYLPDGQLLEVLLFEPIEDGNKKVWRIVDDKKDYTVIQEGESLRIDEERTFEHPFNQVPAVINSNIIDISSELRLSPIHKIIGLMKEFATNQSVKSIYKVVQGNPTHWKVGVTCQTCRGRKKNVSSKGVESKCTDCGGTGNYESLDVTDLTIVPVPREGESSIAPNVSGFVSPAIDFLEYMGKELLALEKSAYTSIWGVDNDPNTSETATGRFIDQQPKLNRLNKYSDVAEWVNWKLAEWIGDVIVTTQPTEESVISISYGRRFILESTDIILEKYEKAKKEQDNSVILDRLLNEYITSKFSNDTKMLRVQLIKVKGEPYVHYSLDTVNEIFGVIEAKRKAFYSDWFNDLDFSKIDGKTIEGDYKKWFDEKIKSEPKIVEVPPGE